MVCACIASVERTLVDKIETTLSHDGIRYANCDIDGHACRHHRYENVGQIYSGLIEQGVDTLTNSRFVKRRHIYSKPNRRTDKRVVHPTWIQWWRVDLVGIATVWTAELPRRHTCTRG